MIEINKPVKQLPLFVIVNYKNMLSNNSQKRINCIVLNDIDVQEIIDKFSIDPNKSKKYYYWLLFQNTINAIEQLRKLIEFMIKEDFKYIVTENQWIAYYETIENVEKCRGKGKK